MPDLVAAGLVAAIAAAAPAASPPSAPAAAESPVAADAVPISSAPQAADPAWPAWTDEIAVLGGYATGTVFESVRVSTGFAQAIVRWGLHFAPLGSGRRRGNFALLVEGVPLFTVDQQPRATGAGVNVLVRWSFAWRRWRPSINAGAGLVGTNQEVPPGETRLNFTPQGGLGLQYLVRPGLAVGGEYRFHHLSNNGRTERNPGINSQLLLFGVSWYR